MKAHLAVAERAQNHIGVPHEMAIRDGFAKGLAHVGSVNSGNRHIVSQTPVSSARGVGVSKTRDFGKFVRDMLMAFRRRLTRVRFKGSVGGSREGLRKFSGCVRARIRHRLLTGFQIKPRFSFRLLHVDWRRIGLAEGILGNRVGIDRLGRLNLAVHVNYQLSAAVPALHQTKIVRDFRIAYRASSHIRMLSRLKGGDLLRGRHHPTKALSGLAIGLILTCAATAPFAHGESLAFATWRSRLYVNCTEHFSDRMGDLPLARALCRDDLIFWQFALDRQQLLAPVLEPLARESDRLNSPPVPIGLISFSQNQNRARLSAMQKTLFPNPGALFWWKDDIGGFFEWRKRWDGGLFGGIVVFDLVSPDGAAQWKDPLEKVATAKRALIKLSEPEFSGYWTVVIADENTRPHFTGHNIQWVAAGCAGFVSPP